MGTNENDGTLRWTVPIDEDGVLTLPDEVWQLLGWKEGDNLEWVEQDDGSILLMKTEDTETVEEEQS